MKNNVTNLYNESLKFKNLGLRPIQFVLDSMLSFTEKRKDSTIDEIWLVQHYPVFTMGTKRTMQDFYIKPKDIPILFSNRGGRVTYHGPGQLLIYVLINLIRRKYSINKLLWLMHQVIILTLKQCSINAYVLRDLPGVYVNGKKICSLGLRIKNGCTFHGMALNIKMDLSPFNYINPCGTNFKMTQIIDIQPNFSFRVIQLILTNFIKKLFI